MSAPDERQWLRHGEHGGYFHCPAAAVDEYLKLGWAPSEPQPEFNAATAEMPIPQPPAPAVDEPPAPKSGKKSGSSPEGSD